MNNGFKISLIIAVIATLFLVTGCGPVELNSTPPQPEADVSANTTASKQESQVEADPTSKRRRMMR